MFSGWGGSTNEGGWRGQSFDRERSSTPASRTGRDFRNSGGRDGHPSGLPRPYGGRGRGSYNRGSNATSNDRQDSGYDSSRWDSGSKDGGDGWGTFSDAKVQNSPGREAFPGGWGAGGSGSGGGDRGGWGSGTGSWGVANATEGGTENDRGWGGDASNSKKAADDGGLSGVGDVMDQKLHSFSNLSEAFRRKDE